LQSAFSDETDKPIRKGTAGRWIRCEHESPELLALCLKRIKNLGTPKGAKLIDAKFIWTEEHSRRIVVRLTVESMEVTSRRDAIRQVCDCEFLVHTQMCTECQSDSVDQTWRAVVQLRQNVSHRRTLYFLEQEILHRKLAEKASNVEESPNGLDVFFNKQEYAVKFADACQALVPVSTRSDSKKLTGQDSQNNEFRFRHTICLEIVPLCKFDLCVLPKPTRSALLGGSKNGLVLVESIARNVHLRDVETGKVIELQASKFAAHPFRPLAGAKELVEFMVLDVERNEDGSAEVETARMRDLGESADATFFVKTWSRFASAKLESGDVVLGYDISRFAEEEFGDFSTVPLAVLVKKQVDKEAKKRGSRKSKANGGGDLQSTTAEDVLYLEEDDGDDETR
jgi:nonsense-mediated mRNA decay protein 3